MILGIGTDIVEVSRIEQKVLHRIDFCQSVFSPTEIAYCDSMKHRYENYAARFAAKEAFLKAIGTGLSIDNNLHEIEVLNENSGKPYIHLSTSLMNKVQAIYHVKHFKIFVSLSHTSTTASAFVIIESDLHELA